MNYQSCLIAIFISYSVISPVFSSTLSYMGSITGLNNPRALSLTNTNLEVLQFGNNQSVIYDLSSNIVPTVSSNSASALTLNVIGSFDGDTFGNYTSPGSLLFNITFDNLITTNASSGAFTANTNPNQLYDLVSMTGYNGGDVSYNAQITNYVFPSTNSALISNTSILPPTLNTPYDIVVTNDDTTAANCITAINDYLSIHTSSLKLIGSVSGTVTLNTSVSTNGITFTSDSVHNAITTSSGTVTFESADPDNSQFNTPLAMQIYTTPDDHSYLYVADSGNNRVQVFSITIIPVSRSFLKNSTFQYLSSSNNSIIQQITTALISLPADQSTTALTNITPSANTNASLTAINSNGVISSVVQARIGYIREMMKRENNAQPIVSSLRQKKSFKDQALLNHLFGQKNQYKSSNIFANNLAGVQQQVQQDLLLQTSSKSSYGNLWSHVYGFNENQGNVAGQTGYNAKTAGALIAFDRYLTIDTLVGLGLGYARSQLDFKNHAGNGNVQSYYMTAYGSKIYRNWQFDVSGVIGLNCNRMHNHSQIGTIGFDSYGRYKSYSLTPRLGAMYHFYLKTITLSPFVSVDHTWNKDQAYQQTSDNGLNWIVNARKSSLLRSEVGAQFAYTHKHYQNLLNFKFKISYINKRPYRINSTQISLPGVSGGLNLCTTNKIVHEVSPSFEMRLNRENGWYYGTTYTAEISRRYKAQMMTLKIGKIF